jgi:cyanophycinase
MCAAVAESPQALGVGIDENTALLLRPGGRVVDVLGLGVVYFLDARQAAPAPVGLGAPFALTPVSLHILTDGDRYDLDARRPV